MEYGDIEVLKLKAGKENPVNLLSNGDFESWSAGASVAPDGWTGIISSRESTIIKLGTYSAKVTRSGTNDGLYQRMHLEKGIAYWKGRTITFSCWVYATVASRANIGITGTSVGNAEFSSFHTGDSTWQLLSLTYTVPADSTLLQVYLRVSTGDTSAYFDGAMLVEGSSAFAFSPKPAEEGVWADYSAVSTIVGWSAFIQKQIYTKKIGKTVFVAFSILGTSNNATTTFTVPYNAFDAVTTYTVYGAVDNGGARVAALLQKSNAINEVVLFKDMASGAFTASGTKAVLGTFTYESA